MKKFFQIIDSYKFYLVISIITGIFLRLYGLNIQSLWYDELVTTALASYTNAVDFLAHCLTVDVHPPLYPVFMHYWIKFIGNSEAIIRLPNTLAGILTIFVMYYLSKKIFDRYVAASTVALISLSGTAIYFSQEARSYSFLILFSAISTLLWLKIIKKINSEDIVNKELLLYGFVCLITAYLHYFGTALIYLQLIYLFIAFIYYKKPLKKMLFLSFIITALFFMWFIPHVFLIASFDGSLYGLKKQNWLVLADLADLIYSKNIILLILVPLILGIKIYINNFKAFAKSISLNSPITSLLYISIVPVIIFCFLSQFFAILYTKYLLIILPAVYLLTSMFILSNPFLSETKGIVYVFLVSALGLYLYMFPTFQIKGSYYAPHKQQWREAVSYIKMNYPAENDKTIIFSDRSPFSCGYYFNFFRGKDKIYKTEYLNLMNLADIDKTINKLTSKKYNRIFILTNFHDLPLSFKEFLTRNQYICTSREYTDLYLNDCLRIKDLNPKYR